MWDVIDERDRKAKMAKAVIKRRNVVYVSPQEEQECVKDAKDTLERLSQERRGEEEKKKKEIESLIEEREQKLREVNRILHEKEDLLERTIQSAVLQEVSLEEAVMEKVVEEALLGKRN